jgi:hypothetical protein
MAHECARLVEFLWCDGHAAFPQYFRDAAECVDEILKDFFNPVGYPPSVNLTHAFIVSILSIVQRTDRLQLVTISLSVPSSRAYIDWVGSTVPADFAAELGRLSGDNLLDLNRFNLFTRDVSGIMTSPSISDPG